MGATQPSRVKRSLEILVQAAHVFSYPNFNSKSRARISIEQVYVIVIILAFMTFSGELGQHSKISCVLCSRYLTILTDNEDRPQFKIV